MVRNENASKFDRREIEGVFVHIVYYEKGTGEKQLDVYANDINSIRI